MMDADPIPLRHTPFAIVILVIAYLIVLVVGLVGNFFVIVFVPKVPKMKTATKYFIFNLAVADLLVLIFCLLPNLISNIYVPWVMGWFMCKAVPYIQGLSVCASVYSLAAISADRLMAVRFRLKRQVTKNVALRIIVLIWIFAAAFAFPWLLYFHLSYADSSDPSLVFCIESWPSQMCENIYFVLVNLGLFYLFPLAFISFCHFSIWLRVRSPPVSTIASVSQRQFDRKRAKASVQKLVIGVVFGFAASWLPLYVISVRIKLIPAVSGPTEEKVLDYALPIAQWLGAANSCINPILYVFFSRNFRSSLQRLFQGCFAYTTPENFPNSPYRHQTHRGAGLWPDLIRLSLVHHRSDLNNSQLQNSRHYAVDSNGVTSCQKNQKLATLTRSQSYMAAMGNPWW